MLLRPLRYAGASVLLGLWSLLLAPASEEQRLTVYSAQNTASLAIVEREGKQYVGVLEALQPFGAVIAGRQGDHWKLRFTPHGGATGEAEFSYGKTRAKIRGKKIDLADPLLFERDRALVSTRSLGEVLSSLLGGAVQFHGASRRLFVGAVAVPFTAQLEKGAPARLLLRFAGPVSPFVATEPGRIRMVFSREPIVSGASSFNFGDSNITSATYSEGNGAAQIEVNGTVPLIARFTDEGRTISIEPAPAPAAAAKGTPAAPPAAAPPAAAAPPPQAPPAVRALLPARTFLVVIDPGHGGQETGALLTPSLAEKEVTLALARRLRADLEARNIHSALLRDGDVALTSEQRAAMANGARGTVYISIHAGSAGTGVRLYSARVSPVSASPGGFLPWDNAQGAYLEQSRSLLAAIAMELNNRHIPAVPLTASLRPLDNVALAAVAVEVAPPAGKVEGLISPAYQAAVTNAIALGIANARFALEPAK